jgi:hypothetical protein
MWMFLIEISREEIRRDRRRSRDRGWYEDEI